jgi:hypothetical protein
MFYVTLLVSLKLGLHREAVPVLQPPIEHCLGEKSIKSLLFHVGYLKVMTFFKKRFIFFKKKMK